MGMAAGRTNLKSFYILKILSERTDDEHVLNASQIMDLLKSEYGITVNRQTVYSEIDKLQAADVDIVLQDGKLGGYYLASRQFELPELKLMVDAVQFSRFITKKKSQELIRKLETLCSLEEAKQLSSQVVVYNRPKTLNETIYYNVDMLHSAIYRERQITFQYAEWTVRKKMELRHGGDYYIASPLHLIWDDENYYLIAFDEKAGKVKHYRVDKIRSLSILKDARSETAVSQQIDLGTFGAKTFGMFGGRDVKVRLKCRNHLAGVVLDRFGQDIWMIPTDADHFSAEVTVTVSPQFFGWVTAIGEDMQLEGPQELVEEYRKYLEKILDHTAFDGAGLIYGMGHAVYSLSDPRERVFQSYVEELAHAKGWEDSLALYTNVEKLAPELISGKREIFKGVSPNVDFYSGFVYEMLGIPVELYTPLFAIARITGWSAHRLEEIVGMNKIIRPAYKSVMIEKQ